MENNKEILKKHDNTKLVLANRSTLNLTGVNKVYSATESCISLMLGGDNVLIDGENLHVNKLDIDTGVVDIDGIVNAIKFGKSKNSKNFIKRIFS